MRLHPDEPQTSRWRTLTDDQARQVLWSGLGRPGGGHTGCRSLVLVDGRSGGGKTTTATRIAALLEAAVVHTDDVAWHLHPTQWADELIAGVIEPWSKGEHVSFRPPGWIAKDRPGSIEVEPSDVLVIEGVGAGRHDLAELAGVIEPGVGVFAVWVQSDLDEARRRGVARDVVQEGRTPEEAEAFWDAWALDEDPFLAAERPWARAGLVVCGTCGGDRLVVGDREDIDTVSRSPLDRRDGVGRAGLEPATQGL